MRDSYDDIKGKGGAEVVAIGMGWPEAAADFRDRYSIPFPLLIDPTKQTYRAIEAGRGSLNDVIGPKVWIAGAKALLRRRGLEAPKQDHLQLGATAVIAPGGEFVYLHRATDSADNAPAGDILRALERVRQP